MMTLNHTHIQQLWFFQTPAGQARELRHNGISQMAALHKLLAQAPQVEALKQGQKTSTSCTV
jgi:hypothetical protein